MPSATTRELVGWNVVVIARDEAERLDACLDRLAAELRARAGPAPGGVNADRITVVLNGCRDASHEVTRRFAQASGLEVRGFEIAFADKSNAWNQYVHELAPMADLHIFVDGYTRVAPGSLAALAAALAADPHAHAASGLPGGRGAAAYRRTVQRDGGLHGSLHALRGSFVERIRLAGLRLPVGLYRGDGLIGSFAMHDLDPATAWDPARVAQVERATWSAQAFAPPDLWRHLRRRVNQARGRLESAAVKRIIYRYRRRRLRGPAPLCRHDAGRLSGGLPAGASRLARPRRGRGRAWPG